MLRSFEEFLNRVTFADGTDRLSRNVAKNYVSMLCDIQEGRRSCLQHRGSLQSLCFLLISLLSHFVLTVPPFLVLFPSFHSFLPFRILFLYPSHLFFLASLSLLSCLR